MDEQLRQQYTQAYGPYAQGEYAIDDQIQTRHYTGVVIWSYRGAHGLTYVIDDDSGFPVEAAASTVIARN